MQYSSCHLCCSIFCAAWILTLICHDCFFNFYYMLIFLFTWAECLLFSCFKVGTVWYDEGLSLSWENYGKHILYCAISLLYGRQNQHIVSIEIQHMMVALKCLALFCNGSNALISSYLSWGLPMWAAEASSNLRLCGTTTSPHVTTRSLLGCCLWPEAWCEPAEKKMYSHWTMTACSLT